MIIAYTGLPGGGKSLSSIPDFILPALAKGRHVFSNIYGLSAMAIAAKLEVNTPGVERLLHRFSMSFRDEAAARAGVFFRRLDDGSMHYSNAEGLALFVDEVKACDGDPLVVFDECHEYFNPRNFAQLDPFLKYLSEARHEFHDILLITQHISDIWEPLLRRVHETDVFERGRLGFRSQYIHRRFAGSNVMAPPVGVSSRVNDKSIYKLYQSHRKKKGEHREHLGYGVSIFASKKFIAFALAIVFLSVFSLRGILSAGGMRGFSAGDKRRQRAAAEAPAPEHASNAIYVKYVVCGAFDCKAARPDGSLLTLPLDYASGKYPIEVRKYAPVSSSVFAPPSLPVPGPK